MVLARCGPCSGIPIARTVSPKEKAKALAQARKRPTREIRQVADGQ
jgi:hypothetical protein